jgi:hypothetical protein
MGYGDGSNGYGNKYGSNGDDGNTRNGNGNKVWRAAKRAMARAARAMMMATKRAMATAEKAMVMAMKRATATDGEDNVDNGKRNGRQQQRLQGQGREEVWQWRLGWRVTKRVMETVGRVMATAMKRARARAARGMATVTKRARARAARGMAMATRVVGN